MGKMKEKPRTNIVSLRVCDDDWELLQRMMEDSRESRSDILRAALNLWIDVNRPKEPGLNGQTLTAQEA